MNTNVWPHCLPERDWQEIRSLTDAVEIFAEDLVNYYRPAWDLQTPDTPQIPSGGRQWYLRRETGLRAFAHYEAELRLKHFSRAGLITGADYCACRLQGVLFNWGWREALSPGCIPPKWKKFILWPEFAPRLQLWKSRKALARHSPDPRIKLYPNQTFTAVSLHGALSAGDLQPFAQHTVRVSGTVEDYKGKPEIVLHSLGQISLVK